MFGALRALHFNKTSCAGFSTGSERSSTASIKLKIAVFAPIPKANVSTATAVNAGLLRNMRSANRTSCHSCSSHTKLHTSRVSSCTRLTLPNFRSAAYRASSGAIPRAMLSCVSVSICSRMSCSRSSIMRSRRFIICPPAPKAAESARSRRPVCPTCWFPAPVACGPSPSAGNISPGDYFPKCLLPKKSSRA